MDELISTRPFSIAHFTSAKKRGLLIVTFAQGEGDVAQRVKMAEETVEIAEALRLGDHPFFSRIDIVVPTNQRYVDHDCGKTKDALVKRLKAHRQVFIQEVPGDAFSASKNIGFGIQLRHGVDYTMTLSPEARGYLNQATIDAITDAVCHGALAIGVAIGELEQSILEGRLAGTFAMWHTAAMFSVGGFDMAAAGRTMEDREVLYVKGWSREIDTEVYYATAGVEEVVPLAYLVDLYGPCIAPLLPCGEGVKRYQLPTDHALLERHRQKMGTKFERQFAHLFRIRRDPSWLKGGVMPQYRPC